MENATPLNRKYLSEFFSQLIAGTKRPFTTCIQFPTEEKSLYLFKKTLLLSQFSVLVLFECLISNILGQRGLQLECTASTYISFALVQPARVKCVWYILYTAKCYETASLVTTSYPRFSLTRLKTTLYIKLHFLPQIKQSPLRR